MGIWSSVTTVLILGSPSISYFYRSLLLHLYKYCLFRQAFPSFFLQSFYLQTRVKVFRNSFILEPLGCYLIISISFSLISQAVETDQDLIVPFMACLVHSWFSYTLFQLLTLNDIPIIGRSQSR